MPRREAARPIPTRQAVADRPTNPVSEVSRRLGQSVEAASQLQLAAALSVSRRAQQGDPRAAGILMWLDGYEAALQRQVDEAKKMLEDERQRGARVVDGVK